MRCPDGLTGSGRREHIPACSDITVSGAWCCCPGPTAKPRPASRPGWVEPLRCTSGLPNPHAQTNTGPQGRGERQVRGRQVSRRSFVCARSRPPAPESPPRLRLRSSAVRCSQGPLSLVPQRPVYAEGPGRQLVEIRAQRSECKAVITNGGAEGARALPKLRNAPGREFSLSAGLLLVLLYFN